MKELVIEEKYSKYWPTVALWSLILAIVFFLAYHLTDNILLVGYVRLASFAFFALALLSYFKVKDGRVEISISNPDGTIESVYRVREEIIFHAEHPISEFFELKIDRMPDKSLYNNFVKNDKCVRFRRKDENDWYYFNEIESRVIPLTEENATKLFNYLQEVSSFK